jgi:hypothetical protein
MLFVNQIVARITRDLIIARPKFISPVRQCKNMVLGYNFSLINYLVFHMCCKTIFFSAYFATGYSQKSYYNQIID